MLSLKRFKKILLWFFLSLLFLILAAWIFIQTPFGQNWIARQVTKRLSSDLQTKVTINHVDFSLFNKMHLQGVLIEDKDHDTLLYAGDIKVRVTDWFFFKKTAEIKYVGMENAIVKFQRTDSVWRQQFIFDYFSTPSSSKKKKAGIQFNLKKMELKNVVFVKKDGWMGEDMTVAVDQLDLEANDISLSGSNYDVKSLVINKPVVMLRNYQRLKPRDSLSLSALNDPEITAIDSVLQWNNGKTTMKIAYLNIKDGTFITDKQTNRPVFSYFDGQHILFNNINVEMNGVAFAGDTVYSRLKLSAKERSGLEVKELFANVKFTPVGMTFNDLDLETNRSTIRNSFSMAYDDMSDLGDFIHKVRMSANFDGSYVDSDDIAFFAPDMKTWNKKITLKGKVRGTVDDLFGKDMIIQAGNSTLLNGDISMTGLPDIYQTFIDFKANDFRTTYNDAVTIVPQMRNVTVPDLKKIQYINFTGSFTGFLRDFVTFGTIRTNLGTVKSDLNMKLPRGQDAVYSGTIATDNFQLGQFLGDSKIGAVSLTGTVKGKGFNEKTRNVLLDGTVRFAEYNNYRYSNITVKGKLDKQLFDGTAMMKDENAELTLNGIIDFNNKPPRFDLQADIVHANLKNLNLTKDSFLVKGKLNFDFTSSNIDNFLGTARITNAEITRNGQRLPFDSLIVSSTMNNNNEKVLTATSNEFTGTLTGTFTLSDLPNTFTHFLNKYYPTFIPPPHTLPVNQSIKFDITTFYVDEYLNLVDSSITGFNNSHFVGDLDMSKNELNLVADIPQFNYKRYNFDNVKLIAKGSLDSLVLLGEAKNIRINDSINIPLATFKINAHNDSSKVSINTGLEQRVEKADINALVITRPGGVKIEFDPSHFVINGKTWTIDENGELQFGNNSPASGSLVLREGDQIIKLQTIPSTVGNWNDLMVDLTKVNLGDISPYFLPKNRLEGLISGSIKVEDPINKFNATADIKTEGLILDNDSIGNVNAHADYNNLLGELRAKGKNTDPDHRIDFDMTLYLKDKLKAKDNHIAITTYRYPISILERFLNTLFSDLRGFITGPVDLNGPLDELSISGKAKLEDAGLRVNFTQCFYKIEDTYVELKPTEINLDGIVLQDTVTGNPVYLNGNIQHRSFKNMFFDLGVSTRKPGTRGDEFNRPILLLNTSYRDNKQFYGRVKGTGSFILTGPQSEMFMQISAIASKTDSSYITIPPASNRVTNAADFLVERKYGHEMSDSGLMNSASNIIYDVDVTANNMLNVKVVLDPLTGDEIKGRGNGTLNIHSGTSEPLTIRGRYDIEEGNYLFTFQSFFKKPFVLRKGSDNFIEWSGDPYKARINLDAVYTANNVSFAPLSNLIEGVSGYRDDVYVVANMYNELFDPRFKFTLEFPPNSRANNDVSIALNVQQIEKNENEINRQVSYLIVFNSFAPPESGSNSVFGNALNEFTYSTISSLLFNGINKALATSLSKILNTDKFTINLSGSLYNRNLLENNGSNNSFAINQGNLNINIPINLIKDKFILTLGSSLDIPLTPSNTSVTQVVQFLPDVTAEFLVNPSGTIRATIFYRQNLDYLTTSAGVAGRNKSAGGSIGLRKEGNTFLEAVFGIKKKKKPTTPAPVVPPVTTEPKPEAKKEEDLKKTN